MEGAFSYCNDLVTIISEKREEKSQTGCQAAMNKRAGDAVLSHNPATVSSQGIFAPQPADPDHLWVWDTFLAPENWQTTPKVTKAMGKTFLGKKHTN